MGSPSTGSDWNSYFWQWGGTVNCRRSTGLEAWYIRTGSSQGCKDTYKMLRMSGRGERCPARLLSAPAWSCSTAALVWRGLIFGVSPWERNAVAALGIAAVGGSLCILSTSREWIWWDICGSDDFEMLWVLAAAQLWVGYSSPIRNRHVFSLGRPKER